MKKIVLGNTGLEVTELNFGALPIGPIQGNKPVDEAARVMSLALRSGVNFFDTAQMYKTYEPIRLAMEETGIRPVISSKSVAASYEDMDAAINEALEKLGLDYIDIFFLHAARVGESPTVFEQRGEALRCLLDHKKRGTIKFAGISCHAVDVVKLAAVHPDIDIVFTIINSAGLGIMRGTREEMEAAIELCHQNGKGVMFMKVLGGGTMLNKYEEALEYALNLSKGRACVSLGMVAEEEVISNVDYFNGNSISEYLNTVAGNTKNMLIFRAICTNCKKCADVCGADAITFEQTAIIDSEKCVTCGYCVGVCPQFAIRFI
ncbi:MAG: aldo/keto reductase [Defluviitaleaceae bacterium]|nr:aldo/keto reductase [Defluviitaleaceae bacterium]